MTTSRELTIEPLTKEAFRPFGDVIEMPGAEIRTINAGFAQRFHDLASIDVTAEGGKPLLSIFRASRRPTPIRISMLERHPLGTQAFFPLLPAEWLVVTAEGGNTPDLRTLRCFRAQGMQGINYAINAWHFPVLVLIPEQHFLVVDRGGPGNNLEEYQFPQGSERIIHEY